MQLIIALGNPEKKYDNTRHNIGFFVADAFAAERGLKWQSKTKFKASIAEGDGFIIAKPTTYYNLAGESARAIADFYKITPNDILIIHDDLALPFGTVRTRIGGSAAGNNGIKSISQHLGDGTTRLRIGTYSESPANQVDFVLGKFTALEQQVIESQLPKLTAIINSFLNDAFAVTTHK